MKTLIVCQEINSQEQAEVPIQVLMSAWLPHTAISPLQLPHNSVNKYLTPLGMPPGLRTKPPRRMSNPQPQWFSNSGMFGRFQNHPGHCLKDGCQGPFIKDPDAVELGWVPGICILMSPSPPVIRMQLVRGYSSPGDHPSFCLLSQHDY